MHTEGVHTVCVHIIIVCVLISKAELFIICKVILFCDCSATAKRLNPAFDQGQGPAGMSGSYSVLSTCVLAYVHSMQWMLSIAWGVCGTYVRIYGIWCVVHM